MINIIPTPKHLEEKNGAFSLKGATVHVSDGCDSRVRRAACTLCRELSEKAGEMVVLSVKAPAEKAIVISISDENGKSEGYKLSVSEDKICLTADSPAGAFYGIQTLRQLCRENDGEIPCCDIDDEPDFSYRGFYHDITRGRVNTTETLQGIADMLAYYKINSLQLYVEDCFLFREFEGINTEDNAMTAEEIIAFDDYCYNNFIELVPSLSSFGHLYNLLQSDKFKHLCELENYTPGTNYWMERQWHHTIDPYNPESIEVIGSTIEQYMALFRTDKFNICCDETMDLCNGRNKGKDKGEAYFIHLNKLIDLLKKHGKTVMMWGDEGMARPELMKENAPSDTVVLNWCYRKTVSEWIPKFYSDLGFEQIVCPGVASWNHFLEDVDTAVGNISDFARHAKKYNAIGILNTNWGDFGHLAPFNCVMYGTLFGAQKSWNVDAPTDEEFNKTATFLLYGVTELNVIDSLYRLGEAEKSCDWCRFVMWHSANCLEGRQTELKPADDVPFDAEACIKAVAVCEEEAKKLRALNCAEGTPIDDIIIAADAIALMNREFLYVHAVDGYCDKEALRSDFNAWLERYKASWNRTDKPSQLWRICEFIENITDVPTGYTEA